jgi:DNA-binding protein H-NS
MTTLADLIKQKEALEAQIAQTRQSEVNAAITKARSIVSEYGLTVQDVFGGKRAAKGGSKSPVAPKFRDPATGNTWSGRGKPPLWIAGKDRAQFAI